MRVCSVMDCLYVDRATHLCTKPFIRVNARRECMIYKMDKKYLSQVWHISIYDGLKSKGYVPETQEMVDIAESLISHSKPKEAGEEART